MNLIPQFSHNKQIEDERLMLQKKFGNYPKRIELFPEGNVLPQGEGNWIPQMSMAKRGMLGWGSGSNIN